MSRNYYHNPLFHGYAEVALYIDRQPHDGAPDWHIDTQYKVIEAHQSDTPAHGADEQTILAEARAALAADAAQREAARKASELTRHQVDAALDAEFAAKKAKMRRGGWGE